MRLTRTPLAAAMLLAVALCASLAPSFAQPLPLPVLPFSYNSFAPIISESAQRVHHLGHHAAYTQRLNDALRELRARGGRAKELAKLGVDTILARLSQLPEDMRATVRNNGGGYVNHDLYFRTMSPPTRNGTDESGAATVPPPPRVPQEGSKILAAIERDFGSFAEFQSQFNDLANSVFGSGWVFLFVDGESKRLRLMQTPNQDNPTIVESNERHVLLTCIDLWEHAYYLDHQNKRAEFIRAWWQIVNWKAIDELYSQFLTYDEIMQEFAQKRQAKATGPPAEAATPPAAAEATKEEL